MRTLIWSGADAAVDAFKQGNLHRLSPKQYHQHLLVTKNAIEQASNLVCNLGTTSAGRCEGHRFGLISHPSLFETTSEVKGC
jgi:hypothetical protein